MVLRTGADSWLDGACGTGWHLRNSRLQLDRMVGADRSATMLDYARARNAGGVHAEACIVLALEMSTPSGPAGPGSGEQEAADDPVSGAAR